jgi:cytochrome oxidase assembly protein ShyY1
MRRLAFLLRPGWVALAVVVIAFTYLCFSVLAPWQLGKNTKTSQENDQIQQSLTTAPVPLKTLLPQQDSSATDAQWRRVTATGHYLADKQLLARLRVVDGEPALEVLLPFVVDGGPTVLVDRGYVRPEQGSRLPPIPPPPHATVTLTARLRDSERPLLDKESFISDGVRQVYSIDTSQIATLTGVGLAGSYLQLVDNQPGGLGVIGMPHLDAGPFL